MKNLNSLITTKRVCKIHLVESIRENIQGSVQGLHNLSVPNLIALDEATKNPSVYTFEHPNYVLTGSDLASVLAVAYPTLTGKQVFKLSTDSYPNKVTIQQVIEASAVQKT